MTWIERLKKVDLQVNRRIGEFLMAPFFMLMLGAFLAMMLIPRNSEDNDN